MEKYTICHKLENRREGRQGKLLNNKINNIGPTKRTAGRAFRLFYTLGELSILHDIVMNSTEWGDTKFNRVLSARGRI